AVNKCLVLAERPLLASSAGASADILPHFIEFAILFAAGNFKQIAAKVALAVKRKLAGLIIAAVPSA
ncbi:hypothetical protein V5799_012582, partial [Amblyomma americanum]